MQRPARNGWRRIAGALGLLGILVYSGLIPGHLISQLRADLVQAELGDALTVICHSGVPGSALPDRQDDKSQTNCPFCKSFASFQFATANTVATVLKRPAIRNVVPPAETAIARSRAGITPLSRGPPSRSV